MALNTTELNELKQKNYEWYNSLLPSDRLPVKNSVPDGIVKVISGYTTELEAEIFRVFLESLTVEAQDTALAIIGESRGVIRYPNESLTEYRQRVIGAYIFWLNAGTLGGLSIALEQLGYRSNIIEHYKDEPLNWSEFSITIYPQGKTYDGSQAELNRILGIIREIKPAHTKLRNLFYSTGGNIWGISTNLYGTGKLFGGNSIQIFP